MFDFNLSGRFQVSTIFARRRRCDNRFVGAITLDRAAVILYANGVQQIMR